MAILRNTEHLIMSSQKTKILNLILFQAMLCILLPSCTKKDSAPETVSDADGNIYKTVQIGSQVWMAENLKTTRLNDGTIIPLVNNGDDWSELINTAYCWYNNDESANKDTYGAIYNGYTAVKDNLCPTGWHLPAISEWRQLVQALGDSTVAGGKLKETGATHWLTPNKGADNSSGFSALPAGIRYFEGTFSSIQSFTGIWSASQAEHNEVWCAGLYFGESSITLNHRNKRFGFSIRCIKDKL